MVRQFGFPRRLRLLSSRDFRAVYQPGRRASSRLFSLFSKPNARGYSRFGITVSRKLGKAARRNGLKRRLREIFRLHQHEVPPGWDIVVNPRHSAVGAAYARLERELTGLLPADPPPHFRARGKGSFSRAAGRR